MKRIVLALLAAFVVVASANTASARIATPEMLATNENYARVLVRASRLDAPQSNYLNAGYKKYSKYKKSKSFGSHSNGAAGAFVVGGVVCSAAGPIINAALSGPVPTPQQVLWHMAGCFIPPLGIYQFIQSVSNP